MGRAGDLSSRNGLRPFQNIESLFKRVNGLKAAASASQLGDSISCSGLTPPISVQVGLTSQECVLSCGNPPSIPDFGFQISYGMAIQSRTQNQPMSFLVLQREFRMVTVTVQREGGWCYSVWTVTVTGATSKSRCSIRSFPENKSPFYQVGSQLLGLDRVPGEYVCASWI